jgi:Putative peptidoglycan binding domain
MRPENFSNSRSWVSFAHDRATSLLQFRADKLHNFAKIQEQSRGERVSKIMDARSVDELRGMLVRTLVRKFLLGTASVLALGIMGQAASNALNYVANAGNAASAVSQPADVRTSLDALAGDPLRTNDIRWAQVQLRDRNLYRGSLDGIVGPETKRALGQFQKMKGLDATASLDAQTWEALTGPPVVEEEPFTQPNRVLAENQVSNRQP